MKPTGTFITTSDLLQMEDREYLFQSPPDSEGYYKSYWTVNRGDIVYTVQNLFI